MVGENPLASLHLLEEELGDLDLLVEPDIWPGP